MSHAHTRCDGPSKSSAAWNRGAGSFLISSFGRGAVLPPGIGNKDSSGPEAVGGLAAKPGDNGQLLKIVPGYATLKSGCVAFEEEKSSLNSFHSHAIIESRKTMRVVDKEKRESFMFCRSCGTAIPAGGKFCPSCGKPASVQAPEQKYNYFFCSQCGQKLRVPAGKGKIEISCPICRNRFIVQD